VSAFNPSCNSSAVNTFTPDGSNDLSSVIATTGLVGCEPTNKTKDLFADLVDNAANMYGLRLLYYRHNIDPKKTHPIYGESFEAFEDPVELTGMIDIASDTSFLSQFGIENLNEVDLQISYTEFAAAFGDTGSPNNGDKFEIKDLLCDRPSGHVKAVFQVTSQGDSDLFQIYKRWFITGRRADFTYIDNEPQEIINDDVFDSAYAGPVDMIDHTPLTGDPQGQFNKQGRDIDTLAEKDFKNDKSEVYGGYESKGGIFFDLD